MPRVPRSELVAPSEINVALCSQLCAQGAYLAGTNPRTKVHYADRARWIQQRLQALASAFAVEVLAYAIMPDRLLLILRNRPDLVQGWTNSEVAERWLKIRPGRLYEGHLGDPVEAEIQRLARDRKRLEQVQLRLSDISWFMRTLSEMIARKANADDKVTRPFWHARFKAQRITDPAGLLASSIHLELNPVIAEIAKTPWEYEFTSASNRLGGKHFDASTSSAGRTKSQANAGPAQARMPSHSTAAQSGTGKKSKSGPPDGATATWLGPLAWIEQATPAAISNATGNDIPIAAETVISIPEQTYVELLSWTAQHRPTKKTQQVPDNLAPLLEQLGIEPRMWPSLAWDLSKYFSGSAAIGRPESLAADAAQRGRKWARSQAKAAPCFLPNRQ